MPNNLDANEDDRNKKGSGGGGSVTVPNGDVWSQIIGGGGSGGGGSATVPNGDVWSQIIGGGGGSGSGGSATVPNGDVWSQIIGGGNDGNGDHNDDGDDNHHSGGSNSGHDNLPTASVPEASREDAASDTAQSNDQTRNHSSTADANDEDGQGDQAATEAQSLADAGREWLDLLRNPIIAEIAEPYARLFLDFVTATGTNDFGGATAVAVMLDLLDKARRTNFKFTDQVVPPDQPPTDAEIAQAAATLNDIKNKNVTGWLTDHNYTVEDPLHPDAAVEEIKDKMRLELSLMAPTRDPDDFANMTYEQLLKEYQRLWTQQQTNPDALNEFTPVQGAPDLARLLGNRENQQALIQGNVDWLSEDATGASQELWRQNLITNLWSAKELSIVGLKPDDLDAMSLPDLLRTYYYLSRLTDTGSIENSVNEYDKLGELLDPPAQNPELFMKKIAPELGIETQEEARNYVAGEMARITGNSVDKYSGQTLDDLLIEWTVALQPGNYHPEIKTLPGGGTDIDATIFQQNEDEYAQAKLDGTYEQPDYTLLVAIASMIFEPIGWAVTAYDVYKDWEDDHQLTAGSVLQIGLLGLGAYLHVRAGNALDEVAESAIDDVVPETDLENLNAAEPQIIPTSIPFNIKDESLVGHIKLEPGEVNGVFDNWYDETSLKENYDVRASVGHTRNMGVGIIEYSDGAEPLKLGAASGEAPRKGFVPNPSTRYLDLPETGAFDSERKILEAVAASIETDPSLKTRIDKITIYTKLWACEDCQDAIVEFEKKYGIKVDVVAASEYDTFDP